MNISNRRSLIHFVLFFLLLLVIAIKLDYPSMLHKGPQSIHA
ncbi:MAG: hypothetical protein AAGG75_16985 [Bacteroidota bacterium]